ATAGSLGTASSLSIPFAKPEALRVHAPRLNGVRTSPDAVRVTIAGARDVKSRETSCRPRSLAGSVYQRRETLAAIGDVVRPAGVRTVRAPSLERSARSAPGFGASESGRIAGSS